MKEPQPFTMSLVIATRGRPEALAMRLPHWAAAGFDEVIVVDSSPDPVTQARVHQLCERLGVVRIQGPTGFRDTRSLCRNLGAKVARGTWIMFQDDDDDAVSRIHRDRLREAVVGRDWLAGPRGEIIVWHQRDAFLAFGGYPEDMVAAEDWIMSNRARRHGVGGPEPLYYEGQISFPPPREDPLSRARNAFWYGYTLLLFLCRCPKRNEVISGDARRLASLAARVPISPRFAVYLAIGLLGRLLSPLHTLGVTLRSGLRAVRKESYVDWQGIRPSP